MEYQAPTPYPSSGTTHSFVERLIGSFKLDRSIFDELRNDPSAMGQAALVTVVAGFLSGFGSSYGGRTEATINDRTYELGTSFLGAIAYGLVFIAISLISWVIVSLLYRFAAIRILGSKETGIQWQEIARPIGFAAVPGALAVLTPIPILGAILASIGGLWALAASIVALSEVFRVSKWRSFGIMVVAAIVFTVVLTLIICVIALVAVGIGSIGG